MGNICARLKAKPAPPHSSAAKKRSVSRRERKLDDAAIREQAIAAAILFKQHQQQQQNFDRSTSLRYPNGVSKKSSSNSNTLPRSSSSRARSLTDPLLQPHQLLNQVNLLDSLNEIFFENQGFYFLFLLWGMQFELHGFDL